MRFPLRLTLDIGRQRFLRFGYHGHGAAAILHLPAAWLPALHENGFERSSGAHTAADSVRTAAKSQAPVLWIGGGEPLDQAEVGRVAFALNARGRNVFLHTDGQRLRQRIHEFRPDARLFLTVEFAGREAFHDRAAGKPGAFRRAMEGIRAAKLSGFYVCAHVSVTDATQPCETGELFEFLDRYDVDGCLVSSGGQRQAASTAAYQDKLAELRGFVRCSRWESFSRLLESSYAGRAVQEDLAAPASTLPAQVETETVETA
jgi:hypothetical protein